MNELGGDIIMGPWRRLVCRLRGHRPVPGSEWQGTTACQRCGLGFRLR